MLDCHFARLCRSGRRVILAALRNALYLDGVHYVESILIDWLAMRYACYVYYGESSMKTSLKGTLATSGYPIRYDPYPSPKILAMCEHF